MNFVEFDKCIINLDTITSILKEPHAVNVYTLDGTYVSISYKEYEYLKDAMKKVSTTYSVY